MKLRDSRLESFLTDFVKLEEDRAIEEAKKLIEEGFSSRQILDLCLEGLTRIGHLYEKQGYFVAGLIIAADLMRNILDLISAQPEFVPSHETQGRILVGTIEGDIHDLGKNVAVMFMRANGYEVIDLGVDVPPAVFLNKTMELQPDMVGISMLISTGFPSLKKAVNFLKTEIPPDYHHPYVAVGGGVIDEHTLTDLGADAATGDFENTLKLCQLVCRHSSPVKTSLFLSDDSGFLRAGDSLSWRDQA
jgi:methanogenic corrinoid protein MtbC1